MKDEVYQFLRNYGFSKDELISFEKHNIKLYEIEYLTPQYNFSFLENCCLDKDEILNLIRKNPYMITVNKKKLDYLEKIYKEVLCFSIEELKKILLNYNDLYIVNPIKVEKIIDFYKSKGYSIEDIKKIIILNPNILGEEL